MPIIGVNTHIDFPNSAYTDLDRVIRCVRYLGVRHLRDSAQAPDTVHKWAAAAAEAGVKFCAYLPMGSPDHVQKCIQYWPAITAAGIIDLYEAPNEPDTGASVEGGGTIEEAVRITKDHAEPYVRNVGGALINISVGSGWTADDGWQGNYDALPDMSAYCSYGNAHTYPGVGQEVIATMTMLNDLARLSMPYDPVMTTELGWDIALGHNPDQIAADIKTMSQSDLSPRVYLYALFDDPGNLFGLFDNDGTPRPGANAVRAAMSR
jgi:hypothetical protein